MKLSYSLYIICFQNRCISFSLIFEHKISLLHKITWHIVFKNCSGKYCRCGLHFSGCVNVVTRNIFSRLKLKWIHIYASGLMRATSFVTHEYRRIFSLWNKSNDGIYFFILSCVKRFGNSSVYRDCFREIYSRENLAACKDLFRTDRIY